MSKPIVIAGYGMNVRITTSFAIGDHVSDGTAYYGRIAFNISA